MAAPLSPRLGGAVAVPERVIADAETGVFRSRFVLAGLALSSAVLAGSWVYGALASGISEDGLLLFESLVALINVATGIAWVWWKVNAYRLASDLSAWVPKRSTAWVFWGYVIPIANFYIPYQMMQEIVDASEGDGLDLSFSSTQTELGRLVVLWWTVYLVYTIGGGIVGQLPVQESGEYVAAGVVLAGVTLVAAALAAIVVVRLTRLQRERALELIEAQSGRTL